MVYRHPKTQHFFGFLWAGLFVLILGVVIFCHFATQRTDPSACMAMRMTSLFTISAMGLSVICSTANWWVKH
jgi:hypothetical protein